MMKLQEVFCQRHGREPEVIGSAEIMGFPTDYEAVAGALPGRRPFYDRRKRRLSPQRVVSDDPTITGSVAEKNVVRFTRVTPCFTKSCIRRSLNSCGQLPVTGPKATFLPMIVIPKLAGCLIVTGTLGLCPKGLICAPAVDAITQIAAAMSTTLSVALTDGTLELRFSSRM
jgi:hypothetical protein